jgi:PAS domain S-box-containing protein
MRKSAHKPNFDKLTISSIEYLLQRQRMEDLLYEVSEAVVGVDKNFHITLFNKIAEKMTGVEAEKALGRDVSEIIRLENTKGGLVDVRKLCFKSEEQNATALKFKGASDFSVNLKSSIIKAGDVPRECLITLTDITREKELEKMKDELFSVASHELRTPITIIKSYLWMLENQKCGDLNQKQKEYLDKAFNATDRILALVNDILNISKVEQGKIFGKPAPLNINDALVTVCGEFEAEVRSRGLEMKQTRLAPNATVLADSDQFCDVMRNLIENAIKYTRIGSIQIVAGHAGSFVKISVIDTGAGVSKENLPKLFNKFGRLNSSYQAIAETKGTGLGLYIVKLYVEGMGGAVGAESEGLGKGSTFWVQLPKMSKTT